MIGEFHNRNESPGLHNPHFRPLRSPIPMLAIRFMAEADLPFLDRITDEPQVRVRYLEAYLSRLGKTISDQKRLRQAEAALKLAQLQLNEGSSSLVFQTSRCPFARFVNRLKRLQFARIRAV